MGLYGMMRTGVSGMAAQSNRLGTIADNIANSNTTGYKRSSTEFSSLVMPSAQNIYESGAVKTSVRHAISQQGAMQFTSSSTDLAISGNGFFVVKDASGQPFLARAGSFVPDGMGRLVNAAGFYLTGYSYDNGDPSTVTNGFNGLEVISIAEYELSAQASTTGVFTANVPSGAEAVDAADLPSENAATAKYSAKSSLVVYDNFGTKLLVDVYFTKTDDNQWEMAMFNKADGSPGTGFPYASDALGVASLEFDPVTGKLSATGDVAITVDVPNGQPLVIDLSSMTQLATDYTVYTSTVNGNSPSSIEEVKIGTDGVVTAHYKDGGTKPIYRIALASVRSPDQLTVLPGNVFSQSPDSGEVKIGFPGTGNLGTILSNALEGSNVDIAEELTNMIESQRNYTANSKTFQTGAELLDVIVNLKR